jgi:SWI/SNF-related matrix-associated actin-dependent regulator of chromatin subfamily A3
MRQDCTVWSSQLIRRSNLNGERLRCQNPHCYSLFIGGVSFWTKVCVYNSLSAQHLDLTYEAHYISNHQSSTFKAVCSLHAEARWAVTGTPLQNRLGDIASMCQFLRVYPYDNREVFNQDIISPWKAGNNQVAVTRLKNLLRHILLRRDQGIVQLPKRTDLRYTLQLKPHERKHYDTVESRVTQSVDAALEGTASSGATFASILQQINELRLICNLGNRRKAPLRKAARHAQIWDSRAAQKAMDAMAATESMSCDSCGLVFDAAILDNYMGSELSQTLSRCWLSSCLKTFCQGCVSRNMMAHCGCTIPCSSAIVTYTPGRLDSGASSPAGYSSELEETLPTKMQALVNDLLKQTPGTKRYVLDRSNDFLADLES